jgi:hypothetical protein
LGGRTAQSRVRRTQPSGVPGILIGVVDDPTIGETTDPDGVQVVLPIRVWQEKIIEDHPEIQPYLANLLPTVAKPDHAAPDPSFENRTRYYARDVGPSRWLLVVVSYEQMPARIVSAFATRKDPKSWSA